MKYTKDNIKVGTEFGAGGENHYIITVVEETTVDFYCKDTPTEIYSKYSLQIVIDALNDGTWKILNQQNDYSIY